MSHKTSIAIKSIQGQRPGTFLVIITKGKHASTLSITNKGHHLQGTTLKIFGKLGDRNPEPFQPKVQNLYEEEYTQCFGRFEFQLLHTKRPISAILRVIVFLLSEQNTV